MYTFVYFDIFIPFDIFIWLSYILIHDNIYIYTYRKQERNKLASRPHTPPAPHKHTHTHTHTHAPMPPNPLDPPPMPLMPPCPHAPRPSCPKSSRFLGPRPPLFILAPHTSLTWIQVYKEVWALELVRFMWAPNEIGERHKPRASRVVPKTAPSLKP